MTAAVGGDRRRVLVAMSGGVDSSVAAALLVDAGHDVVGATMKLWGGLTDSGCCSLTDVNDARRVADRLGIEHHVVSFVDEFEELVVGPYVTAHAAGRTPNPCIECNRRLKFELFVQRARRLGFDAVATGHHARVVADPSGRRRVARGADPAKDQSYVLHMLDGPTLGSVLFPVGDLTKAQVRAIATRRGLPTAGKPDSQDVCFVGSTRDRAGFLRDRVELTPGVLVDRAGHVVGSVDAVQLVTVGQRRGLGLAGGPPRYVVAVDVAAGVVHVGGSAELEVAATEVSELVWSDGPVTGPVLAQVSAHGRTVRAAVVALAAAGTATVEWEEPVRRVAPGQSVVFYDEAGDQHVLGGGVAR